MTRIGPADQILILLRARLEQRSRVGARAAEAKDAPDAQARLAALASVADLPERSFRRALVRGLLADRLGEELAGDPAFDDVVGDVLDLIENNPETAALLAEAGAALRRES